MIYQGKAKKVSIYVNTACKTAAQVKAETGCTALINGGFFDLTTFKPYCHLKINGVQLAIDQYPYWGYAVDAAGKMALVQDYANYPNFISCVCMVRDGKAEKMYYNADVGGARPRTAIGLFPDGRIWLYCDLTNKTPEQLQQIALNNGVQSALMLDGGGSTQGITPSGTVKASRIVHNYICVWTDATTDTTEDKPMSIKICLDPGHGGNENYNCSPDKSYYEHEFALDIAKRLKALLTPYMDVVMTREADITVSLLERAYIANSAGADAFVSLHSNAVGSTGWNDTNGLCVYTYAAGGQREVLAKSLLTSFTAAGIKLLGSSPYHSNFTVLAKTTMPACLIEHGFHTNQNDVALLKTSTYRDKLALAAAKGICAYFGITFKEPPAPPTTEPTETTQPTAETNADRIVQQLIDAGISTKDLLIAIANKI